MMPNNVNMTDHQKEVICKIIYAVETGGQVYGNCRYDDFTEAYANTSNETAITIGAGQWYANEAKRLLQLIKDTDPATFKKSTLVIFLAPLNWTEGFLANVISTYKYVSFV